MAAAEPVIEYRAPDPPRDHSHALPAALLMVPGLCGWVLLVGALGFNHRLAWTIGPGVGLIIWIVALICALVSFSRFRSLKPKPWYVQLCLVSNALGIAFTILPTGWLVFLGALLAVGHGRP